MGFKVGLAFLFVALLSATSGAQSSRWSFTSGHSISWNGQREVLAGLRVDGSADAIKAGLAQGFSQFCVDLPVASESAWKQSISALEGASAKYLLSISSLAPHAEAIGVDPQGYRIAKIDSAQHVSLSIPSATSMLVVFAQSADGSIEWNKVVDTPGGHLEMDIDPQSTIEHVLIVYPRLAASDLLDCWEGFDEARDSLLGALGRTKPGPGCRGIINPVGVSPKLFGGDLDAIPTSKLFRLQFRQYLENTYHNVDTAINAWSMRASTVDNFDRLARLIPLWSGSRGIPGFWDPETNDIILADSKHSAACTDFRLAVQSAARTRFAHLVESIHKTIDVPVVQDWIGWSLPYEGAPLVDGVSAQTEGSSHARLMELAGRAASSVLRWNKPGWLIAPRMQGLDGADANSLQGVVDDLASIGTRAFFLSSQDAETIKRWQPVASRIISSPPSDDKVFPLFFPENAYNPALPQSLPGGIYWLPTPDAGDRIDFGSQIRAYTIGIGASQRIVLWSPSDSYNLRLRLSEPKRAVVKLADGTPVTFKSGKDWIEIPLSPQPIVLSGLYELPVPEPAIAEMISRVEQLLSAAEGLHRDVTSDAFAYHDGRSSLDRSPGGGFLAMQRAYINLSKRLSDYNWIEVDTSKNFTLGQALDMPGCSGGRAFEVRSQLSLTGKTYRIELPVASKSSADQVVWLAAKIPVADRNKVRIVYGSQALPLASNPVGHYGDGFAWYRCGITRLGHDSGPLAIQIDGSDGIDAVFDVVLLAPEGITPNGTVLPNAMNFDVAPVRKKSARARG